jgi:carbamoyl-phosphate synthase small subunit
MAAGSRTYKLKFGHRGSNHPVLDKALGKVVITTQNHGFAVDENRLGSDWEITHVNLNDNTNEGISHKSLPLFSVQYHPEAHPGPMDSMYLFDKFVKML